MACGKVTTLASSFWSANVPIAPSADGQGSLRFETRSSVETAQMRSYDIYPSSKVGRRDAAKGRLTPMCLGRYLEKVSIDAPNGLVTATRMSAVSCASDWPLTPIKFSKYREQAD